MSCNNNSLSQLQNFNKKNPFLFQSEKNNFFFGATIRALQKQQKNNPNFSESSPN